MRYRIGCANSLCLGRSIGTDFNLNNDLGKLNKNQYKILQRVSKNYIKLFSCLAIDVDGCDFGWLNEDVMMIGTEASYQWQRTLIFEFDLSNKENSSIVFGTAFGPYGSRVATNVKFYRDYKRKGKYIKFIDTWYDKIKENFKKGKI